MDEDKYKVIHLGFNNPLIWGVEIDSQSCGGCSLAFTTQDPMEDEAWHLLSQVIRMSRPLANGRRYLRGQNNSCEEIDSQSYGG